MKNIKIIISIIFAFCIVLLSSCDVMKYNAKESIKLLFFEKDVIVDNKDVFSEEDLMIWFENCYNAFLDKGDNYNRKMILGKFGVLNIFNDSEEAHSAFIAGISNYINSKYAYCRVNNIVLFSTTYYDVENEKIQEFRKIFDTKFQINENDYMEFLCPLTMKYCKNVDVCEMMSYFYSNDNYTIEKKEYGDISATDVVLGEVYAKFGLYIIKNTKEGWYLSIQKFPLYEEIYGMNILDDQNLSSLGTCDLILKMFYKEHNKKDGIGIVLYNEQYLIWLPTSDCYKLFKTMKWC